MVFVTVVDRNGYSAAAEHLGLSQATVSFHVRSLEHQLGTSIVAYEHHTVRVSATGSQVYRSARRMLAEQQRLLHSLRAGRAGQLTLGVSIAFEQAYFVEQVIAPFHRTHPDVLLSVRFGHSVGLAEAVLDHQLDLAYLIGWHIPSGLRYKRLHHAAFTFFVAENHPLAHRQSVTIADVAEAGLITAPLDDVEWAHYGHVLGEVGLSAADVALEIDGIQARVLAARAGLGVLGTFHPDYAATRSPEELAPLPLNQPAPTVDVGLVRRRVDTPTAATTALGDWIHQITTDDHPHP